MTKCVEDKTGGGDVSRGFFKCSPKKKKALFPGRGAEIPKSAARSDRLPGIRPQWGSCRDPVRAGAFGVGRVFPPLGVKPHPGPEPIPKSGFAARGSRRERTPSRAIRARRPGRLPPHTSLPSPKMASVFLLSLHKLWCFLCGRRFGSGAKWPVPARGSPHGTPPWPLSVSYLRSSLVSPHNKASLSLASLREPIDCARMALRTWKGPACEPLDANAIPGNPENIARATGILVLKFLTSPVWGRGRRRPAQ